MTESRPPIVIVGSGLAAYNVARELRRLDAAVPLRLITADDGAFYSKPALSNGLSAGKDEAALVTTSAEAMGDQLRATVLTRARVGAIDPGARTVTVGGEALRFDKLVLAVGATPAGPPFPVEGRAGRVVQVNDLDGYRRLWQLTRTRQRVAVVGGGLIGCELANDLVASGHTVDVFELGDQPLARLVPAEIGAAARRALAAVGIRWHLRTAIQGVEAGADGARVTFGQGEAIDVDFVLCAIGLRPRTELATAAGLRVARGIVVDRWLRASAADVFAIGDCAEVEGHLLPFVMPLVRGARALARTLAGEPTPVDYPAMPVAVKTPAFPLVISAGSDGQRGDWQVTAAGDGLVGICPGPGERLEAFALAGACVSQKSQYLARCWPLLAAA